MPTVKRHRCTPLVPALVLGVVVAALGCGPPPEQAATPAGVGPLTVELVEPPSVRFDPGAGATTVAATVTVRGHDRTPLGPQDVEITLLLDDRPLDSESLLHESSAARAVNLTYSLVLDATYSMLVEHGTPAFEPMKAAARQSVQAGLNLWEDRPGSFTWGVSWFDDYIYRPEGDWPDSAILAIPAPTRGAFTRLYAAVDHAIADLPRLTAGQAMAAPHHVMVVFSDGKDNHSWNAMAAGPDEVVTSGELAYRKVSWPATDLARLTETLRQRPDITLHAIGMGRAINDAELRALADAGRGIYVKNPDADHVGALFEQVTREFTTLQTLGATIPNPPGDYALTVMARAHGDTGEGQLVIRLHAGDLGAQVLPYSALTIDQLPTPPFSGVRPRRP